MHYTGIVRFGAHTPHDFVLSQVEPHTRKGACTNIRVASIYLVGPAPSLPMWDGVTTESISKCEKYRSQQKELHRCGNKSYAELKAAMEKKRKGPVGPIEFYKATHRIKKRRHG